MTTLHELEDKFLDCRTLRHRFSRIPDDGGIKRAFEESSTVARLAKRCDRCKTKRYEAWSRITGEILFVQYIYPKGYSLVGEKASAREIRLEMIQRTLTVSTNGKKAAKKWRSRTSGMADLGTWSMRARHLRCSLVATSPKRSIVTSDDSERWSAKVYCATLG